MCPFKSLGIASKPTETLFYCSLKTNCSKTSSNLEFILFLHPNLFHLSNPHRLPFLSGNLLYNTIIDKEDKQSRPRRNDWQRIQGIYVG